MMRRLCTAALLVLTACTSSAQVAQQSTSPSLTPASTTPSTPTADSSTSTAAPTSSTTHATLSLAQRIFNGMSEAERVGQLLMVDCPTSGVTNATTVAITQDHVGSVILDGTSNAGLQAIRGVTLRLRDLSPPNVGLFIATDQEGGLVQRLQGSGFTRIVSALQQGTIAPATLRRYAQGWGNQLLAAGVNVNLAPVLDTVPPHFGSNPPIGDLDREFGHTPAVVTAHGMAVVRGMTAAGVDVTVKHFPGLGRVRGNTDTTSGVTDSVTTRDDPYLAPFRAAAQAGVPFVMMSTAIYSQIAPGVPAAFSRTVVTGLLRGDLGFRGLIISDDLGGAKQVSGYSVGNRAIAFVAAGGDVVLTVDATEANTMTAALLAKARSNATFKRKVDAAALLVLQEKQARGLLG